MVATYNILLFGLALVVHSCTKVDHEIIDPDDAVMIYSGVHDPAQLVEINNELVLFASAVEWSSYAFTSNEWQLGENNVEAEQNHI